MKDEKRMVIDSTNAIYNCVFRDIMFTINKLPLTCKDGENGLWFIQSLNSKKAVTHN